MAAQGVKGAGRLPALAGALQGCHVEAPEAQGRRHGEQHSQPAARHDERHEQAKVMHSWDLQEAGKIGCWSGLGVFIWPEKTGELGLSRLK